MNKETLEEFAEQRANLFYSEQYEPEGWENRKHNFIEGAKYQQSISESEKQKDMENFLEWIEAETFYKNGATRLTSQPTKLFTHAELVELYNQDKCK
jgi:hypothetical protein